MKHAVAGLLLHLAAILVAISLLGTLNVARLDTAMASTKFLAQGTTEVSQLRPSFWNNLQNSFSPWYLLSQREAYPTLANPRRVVALIRHHAELTFYYWLCNCGVAILTGVVAFIAFAAHGWRYTLSPLEFVRCSARPAVVSLFAQHVAFAALLTPAVAALSWYITTDRDLNNGTFLTVLPFSMSFVSVYIILYSTKLVVIGAVLARRWRRTLADRTDRCQACGYQGHGAIACPECGRARLVAKRDSTVKRWVQCALGTTAVAVIAIIGGIVHECGRDTDSVSEWLKMRRCFYTANRDERIACFLGEVVEIRWPDGFAYVCIRRWDDPLSGPFPLGQPIFTVITAGLLDGPESTSDAQLAPQVELVPFEANQQQATLPIGKEPYRLTATFSVSGNYIELRSRHIVDFCRYHQMAGNSTTLHRVFIQSWRPPRDGWVRSP